MDTLFRVLCRHLRTIWLRGRSLFLSIRFRRLRTSASTNTNTTTNTKTTTATNATRAHRPPTPMPASSTASLLQVLSTARTRVFQWVCVRAHELKAHMMRERRAAMTMTTTGTMSTTSTKRAVYTRMGAAAAGPGKEDVAGAMRKYCEDDANEEAEEEARKEDNRESGDDADGFEALFKSLSSSPPLRLDAWRRYGSPFSPSLSLPSPTSSSSTRGLLTPALLEPEFLYALPSPTMSYSSSSASHDTSAPVTPTTPTTTMTPRTHLCPRPHHPRSRAHFRTFSASITPRSPLSLSFPLSLSLPLAARRASSPGGTALHQCMSENEQDEDHGEEGDRDVEDESEREREDPFGTYGRAYYAPGARAALGFGDAYDLSAWTWARDCAPCGGAKKRKTHVRAERHADPAAKQAADAAGAESGPGPVYRAPIHAASAPQLSCAPQPDGELECLRALANATARGRVARPPDHEPVRANARDRGPRHRSGIRPLLLPQKFGLTGAGCKTDKTDGVVVSSERGRKATGWELDLERGVLCGEGDGAEA